MQLSCSSAYLEAVLTSPLIRQQISLSKPSSTRLPFFLPTAPLSPVSLPSLSTKSIPSATCHNNITCPPFQLYVAQPTLFTSDLPSSSFTSTSIQSINPEVMVANTSNPESNSTGPQFQTLYVTSMPYLGTPGSPFFEGANISEFLEKFENMCNDY